MARSAFSVASRQNDSDFSKRELEAPIAWCELSWEIHGGELHSSSPKSIHGRG